MMNAMNKIYIYISKNKNINMKNVMKKRRNSELRNELLA